MNNVEAWFIGYISQALEKSKVKHHHNRTWFYLFLEDNVFCITGRKNDKNENEVIVYKSEIGKTISWCENTNAPIVFQGTLQIFENWLQQ